MYPIKYKVWIHKPQFAQDKRHVRFVVLEQAEEDRAKDFENAITLFDNGVWKIVSAASPCLVTTPEKIVYVRGYDRGNDDYVGNVFTDKNSAKQLKKEIIHVFNLYNAQAYDYVRSNKENRFLCLEV